MKKLFSIGLFFAVAGIVFSRAEFLAISKVIIFTLFVYAIAKYIWQKFIQVRPFQKRKVSGLSSEGYCQKGQPSRGKISKSHWHALNNEGITLHYPWDDR